MGAGYWGPNLIRTFSSLPDCDVAWVCDLRRSRLDYVSEHFPAVRVTEQYSELLADPTLDAVAIATHAGSHRPLAEAALQAGKHVFVEKPLAAHSRDARAIVEAAERANRILATGHVYVYHPAVIKLREAIRAGELGKLCYIESSRVNLAPPDGGVNVIWDLAPHDVSIVLALLGTEPIEVRAEAARHVHPTMSDVAFLKLSFASGLQAHIHVSWLSPVKVRRFFVAGTKGSAIFDDTRFDGKLVMGDRGDFHRPGRLYPPEIPTILPLTAECAHFIDCIKSQLSPEADGRAGLSVVRILEAAQRSISLGGRPVGLEALAEREVISSASAEVPPRGGWLTSLNPNRNGQRKRLAKAAVKLVDNSVATESE